MRSHFFPLVTILSLILTVGCGSKSTTGTAAIAEVVHEFLEGVRVADSETTNKLLTPLALERTSGSKMPITPPGSPTAKFEVGNVELIDASKAVVESVWMDVDVDGKPTRDSMTWALKLSNGAWRICGMAADRGPDLPPIVLDFEDPTEIMRMRSEADNQPQRPTTPLQATQPPQDPFRTVPR